MVAITYTDIAPVQRTVRTTKQQPARRPANTHQDPVVDMTTRLLTVPLHQVYALLWRTGLLVADK